MQHETKLDKLKRRAASILNQAQNAANEHEASVFRAKAFAIMAEYGLDEAELRSMKKDPGKVVVEKIPFGGKYSVEQCRLMHAIAHSLHCESTHLTDYSTGTVYGVESHVQRVKILFDLLRPQMLKEMQKSQPWEASQKEWTDGWFSPSDKAGITRSHRRSFAIGFAAEIELRIGIAERDVIREAEKAAAKRNEESGAALVLMSDHEKAKGALATRFGGKKLRVAKYKQPGEGYHEGRDAGSRADIAGDRTLAPKRAIGA